MPPRRGPSSAQLCIFCQLASSRNGIRYIGGIPSRSSTPVPRGARPIHTGSPSRTPPPESQPQPSSTPRSPWTSAAQPGYGKSSDYNAIDKFLQFKKANPPKEAQRYKPAGDLGKWTKSAPLFDSIPDFTSPQQKPDIPAIKKSPFQSATQANAIPLKFSFLSPRPDANPELSVLEDAKRQSAARPPQEKRRELKRAVPSPAELNPYADVLKSKQSSKAIEDNIFDGVESKSAPPPPSPGIGEIFSQVRLANGTNNTSSIRGTNYSEATRRLNISPASMSSLMNNLDIKQETVEPAKPQFSFMAARNNLKPGEVNVRLNGRPNLKMESEPEPVQQHPDLIKALPDGIKRIDSSSWQSSSREKWTYDIDLKAEAEAQAKRVLENDPRARMTPEELEAEANEAAERKKDIERLIEKAKSMKFRVGYRDLGVWKGEYERSNLEEVREISVQKRVFIPKSITVANLSNVLKVPLETLQKKMALLGLETEQCAYDYILDSEMASLIVPEFGFEAELDEQAGFDLFPQPLPEDPSKIPLRPPIVTIMGHVDHGKTTLLDTLRKTSVAASEAGGITQHIGAFSVSLPSGEKMTFLDTPGHAAFLTMRERGANVTDIVVLVVAADDSVMPQTLEAIAHAKSAGVPLVVAINKCDLVGVDVQRVKTDLLSHQVELEEFGGEVQCVEVSGKTGEGLDKLEAAIVTLAEVLEMRAPTTGMVEGQVIESTIDAGRGTYATVLVKRGTLKTGDYIVAGTTYAKVRRMTTADGKSVKKATPGTPVEVSGWKERPEAGDLVLQAAKESDAKLAIRNREAAKELERNLSDVSAVNAKRMEQRKELMNARQAKMVAAENKRSGMALPGIVREEDNSGPKILPVIIKADVSGSAEAVEEAIKHLGNSEVKVDIVHTSVGEFTETDVMTAIAGDAKMIGFNIRALNPSLRRKANEKNIEVIHHSVIYHLIDDITNRLESMLAPMIETRVTGEAEVTQIFDISAGTKNEKKVGGCKVFSGIISRKEQCRVTRNGKIIFTGVLDTLRHFKDDVKEVRKDMDCGLSFAEFKELKVGDLIQSFNEVQVKRKLY